MFHVNKYATNIVPSKVSHSKSIFLVDKYMIMDDFSRYLFSYNSYTIRIDLMQSLD